MDDVQHVKISACTSSPYIRPVCMNYEQNGNKRVWHLMKVHDSVAIVLFIVSRQVLLFVKQFRPAIYYNDVVKIDEKQPENIDTSIYPGSSGVTLELCAGIVDKDLPLVEIAREEILEECGYDVPASRLEKVSSYRSGVGIIGSIQTLFYAEVTDDMKINDGGGNLLEGELIDVVELTIEETKDMMNDEKVPRPSSLLFALSWFLNCRLPQIVK